MDVQWRSKKYLSILLNCITIDGKIPVKGSIIFEREFNKQLQLAYNERYDLYEEALKTKFPGENNKKHNKEDSKNKNDDDLSL